MQRTDWPETPLKRVLRDEGRMQKWLITQLAERGIKAWPDQVSRWVKGVHEPVDETKAAIADALGRSVEELWPVKELAA